MTELLEKISSEMCWDITAKILMGFMVLRGVKIIMPLLGKVEGLIAPVLAKEKWQEINDKVMADGGKQFFPMVKEMFNIPVDDAVDVAKLTIVALALTFGPGMKMEIVEENHERVVTRIDKCITWKWCRENELEPVLMACPAAHKVWCNEGLKAVDPKIVFNLTKAMPFGDPYCEYVIEFKDE